MGEAYLQWNLRGSCRPRTHLCPATSHNAAQCLYEEPGKTRGMEKSFSGVHQQRSVCGVAVRLPNTVYSSSWKRNCNVILACGGSPEVRSGQPISTSAPIVRGQPVHLACGSGEAGRELRGSPDLASSHLVTGVGGRQNQPHHPP